MNNNSNINDDDIFFVEIFTALIFNLNITNYHLWNSKMRYQHIEKNIRIYKYITPANNTEQLRLITKTKNFFSVHNMFNAFHKILRTL